MYYHTIGKHPERIKNLYFLFAFVLHAVTQLKEELLIMDYQTGIDKLEDSLTS